MPSRRISGNQGLRLISTFEGEHVSGLMPAEVREITAAEWKTRRK
jgi:hypothetical protein